MKRLLFTVLVSSLAAGVGAWILFPLTSTTALAQQHGTTTGHGKAPTKGHGKAPAPTPPVACGEEGQPHCPLQGWMEDNAGPAAENGDAAAMADVYTKIAGFSPDPTWNTGPNSWRALSEAGATKARAGDVRGARAACKACHTAWRTRYKAEHRHDPVPGVAAAHPAPAHPAAAHPATRSLAGS